MIYKKNSKSDNKSKYKNTNLDIYIHKMFHLWFSINNSNNSRYTTSFKKRTEKEKKKGENS